MIALTHLAHEEMANFAGQFNLSERELKRTRPVEVGNEVGVFSRSHWASVKSGGSRLAYG
jgi:hypothetical protein